MIHEHSGDLADARRRIAELEALEDERLNREFLLDRIIDQSPFATWISDSNGLMIRCNPALKRFLKRIRRSNGILRHHHT